MASEWLSVDERRQQQNLKIIPGDEGEGEEEDGTGQVGLYGYRRQGLAVGLLGLLFLVVINLGMTLWMLTVMEFSSSGLGPLTVLRRGIQLHGEALVCDKLVASRITSRHGQPIQVESSGGITLQSRTGGGDGGGRLHNKLILNDDQLQVYASGMLITDPEGRTLFSADKKEVLVGADQLKVTGEGGAAFHGSVQTPLVRSSAGQDLRLESPTRTLNVFASHGVGIESRAGDITASCLKDMTFQSKAGAVKVDTQNVFLGRLPTAQLRGSRLPAAGVPVEEEGGDEETRSSSTLSKIAGGAPEVFQVCLCGGKGRLFLTPAGVPCLADAEVCR